jgi:hypothetical protein
MLLSWLYTVKFSLQIQFKLHLFQAEILASRHIYEHVQCVHQVLEVSWSPQNENLNLLVRIIFLN